MEVGQKVYLKNRNHGNINEITESQISKIGRKYFYVGPHSELKFNINTLAQESGQYSPNWVIYLSMQEILDEEEYSSTARHIEKIISSPYYNKITLDQLRQIKRIIDGGG